MVACSTCHCGTKRDFLPSLSPTYTAFSFFSAPLPRRGRISPPPPSQREGGDQGYFMQGASPLASPGLNPGGRLSSLPYRYPCGGLVRLVACSTCHCGTKRECLPSLSPVYTAFSFCCCPHPPPPSRREGGDQGYFYARGYRPRHPGIKLLAALTAPAQPALRREAYPGDSTDRVRASGRVFPRKYA